jgi:hypothetical protein
MQPQQMTSATTNFDPRNWEIKTRSVEQTLLPLVQQVYFGIIVEIKFYFILKDFYFGEFQREHNCRRKAQIRTGIKSRTEGNEAIK